MPASPQECFELLAAVDRYREWNGELMRELEVLQAEPLHVRAVIYVKQSPFMKTFELCVAVRTEPPSCVYIDRIPNEPTDPEGLDLRWRVEPADAGHSHLARLRRRRLVRAGFLAARRRRQSDRRRAARVGDGGAGARPGRRRPRFPGRGGARRSARSRRARPTGGSRGDRRRSPAAPAGPRRRPRPGSRSRR